VYQHPTASARQSAFDPDAAGGKIIPDRLDQPGAHLDIHVDRGWTVERRGGGFQLRLGLGLRLDSRFRLGRRLGHSLDPVLADIYGEDHGDDDENEQHPGHKVGHGGVIAFIVGIAVG